MLAVSILSSLSYILRFLGNKISNPLLSDVISLIYVIFTVGPIILLFYVYTSNFLQRIERIRKIFKKSDVNRAVLNKIDFFEKQKKFCIFGILLCCIVLAFVYNISLLEVLMLKDLLLVFINGLFCFYFITLIQIIQFFYPKSGKQTPYAEFFQEMDDINDNFRLKIVFNFLTLIKICLFFGAVFYTLLRSYDYFYYTIESKIFLAIEIALYVIAFWTYFYILLMVYQGYSIHRLFNTPKENLNKPDQRTKGIYNIFFLLGYIWIIGMTFFFTSSGPPGNFGQLVPVMIIIFGFTILTVQFWRYAIALNK